jgi:hypothetical protein
MKKGSDIYRRPPTRLAPVDCHRSHLLVGFVGSAHPFDLDRVLFPNRGILDWFECGGVHCLGSRHVGVIEVDGRELPSPSPCAVWRRIHESHQVTVID